MVIPADPEEMKQFQEQCVAQCQCAVDISLPLAYVLLPSKQAFQSIYNRCGYRAGATIIVACCEVNFKTLFVDGVPAHSVPSLPSVSDMHLFVGLHVDSLFSRRSPTGSTTTC